MKPPAPFERLFFFFLPKTILPICSNAVEFPDGRCAVVGHFFARSLLPPMAVDVRAIESSEISDAQETPLNTGTVWQIIDNLMDEFDAGAPQSAQTRRPTKRLPKSLPADFETHSNVDLHALDSIASARAPN
jgi:hypothetical protein